MKINKKNVQRIFIQLIGIAALVFIDYLTKEAAIKYLKGNGTFVLIKGVYGLTYAENTGAAFSMFSSSTDMLSLFTGIAITAVLIYIIFFKKPLVYDICLPFIVAGGLGNLIDRMTRGYVVDYLHTLFVNFPIYNFADCLITCSAVALIIYLLYEIVRDTKKEKNKEQENG